MFDRWTLKLDRWIDHCVLKIYRCVDKNLKTSQNDPSFHPPVDFRYTVIDPPVELTSPPIELKNPPARDFFSISSFHKYQIEKRNSI